MGRAPVRIGKRTLMGDVVAHVPAGKDAHRALTEAVGRVFLAHRRFEPVRSIDRVLVQIPRGREGKMCYYATDAKMVVMT